MPGGSPYREAILSKNRPAWSGQHHTNRNNNVRMLSNRIRGGITGGNGYVVPSLPPTSTRLAAIRGATRNTNFTTNDLNLTTIENNELLFGYSLSMSADGNTIAIGAPKEIELSGAPRGFLFETDTIEPRGFLFETDILQPKAFSFSDNGIPLTEEILFSGLFSGFVFSNTTANSCLLEQENSSNCAIAYGDETCRDDSNFLTQGTVRVYKFDGDNWNQTGNTLHIENVNKDISFGTSVSLSDDGLVLLVGAPFYSAREPILNKGIGSVFEFNTLTNSYDLKKQGSDDGVSIASADAFLGYSTTLSGDGSRLAIGGPGYDSTTLPNTGITRTFNISNIFIYDTHVSIEGTSSNERFGASIAMSSDGNTLVSGSPYFNNNTGKVITYEYNATYDAATDTTTESWIQKGNILNGTSNNSNFGNSVAISENGSIICVGSKGDSTNSIQGEVKVYKFNNITNTWDQYGSTIAALEADDETGYSVSISHDGDTIAISSPGTILGSVRIFQKQTDWVLKGNIINNEVKTLLFGSQISLSYDGNIVAIGDPAKNNNKGQVKIYSYNQVNDTWNILGQNINPPINTISY